LKIQKENGPRNLLNRVESVSAEIQLLALNIAVAAAKMAQRKDPGLEVHHKLSNLVNQATQAVRQMNRVVNAAKTENDSAGGRSPGADLDTEMDFVENIESSLNDIIADSERITVLLNDLREG
jgi:methyl-accepting chemotaxis protein